MEWIVVNSTGSDWSLDVCGYSECSMNEPICIGDCTQNTGLCPLKIGGPTCNDRSCGVYIG